MKLNAEILFHEISREFPAEMTGYQSDELIIDRPEFYLDENIPFRAGHLYVMAGERISRRVPAEKGAVILCTGTAPQMSYFLERCCFIRIRGNADLLRLFNLLQTIFDRYAQIPVDYVCSKFDSVFPGSITFENRANIISFIETDPLEKESGCEAELLRRIDLLVGTMDLKVGLSAPFTDPYSARQYYSQAKAALENGLLFHPETTCYNFDDYALTELILNAQSDLPLDLYFSDGLRGLLDHDRDAPISYIETLRVYLSQNMNVTRTAAELFIHRSTLLERLSRIARELGEDLEDPDVRLRLQILLKALEMQDTVQKYTS